MALPYKKWTDEEIQGRNVSPEGNYPFRIINGILKTTKPSLDNKGQQKPTYPMLELEFEYHDANGQVKKQKDWFVFCEGMDWKLRHLAKTTGTLEFYDLDELDLHHLIGKTGVFLLGIKEYEDKGEKKKSNFVKDYIVKKVANSTNDEFLNDAIPF